MIILEKKDILSDKERKRQLDITIRNNQIKKDKYIKYPKESIIPAFRKELLSLGYDIQCEDDCIRECLKYPLETNQVALKYYKLAVLDDEKIWIMECFHSKKNIELIPFFIEDLKNKTKGQHWLQTTIAQFLRFVFHEKYFDLYEEVIRDKTINIIEPPLGDARCYLMAALWKCKNERTKKLFLEFINDDVFLCDCLIGLSKFKDESFRELFIKYLSHEDEDIRDICKKAIKILDKQKEKNSK